MRLSAYQLAKNACFLTFEPCFLAVRTNDYRGDSQSCNQGLADESDLRTGLRRTQA